MNGQKTLHQFNTIADEIDSFYHRAAGKMGFSDSEMLVLYLLCDYGEALSQSDIIGISGMSKQTINSAVNTMEQKGWLTRAEKSGRKRCLHLTQKGREIIRDVIVPFQRLEESIFDSWTEEDQQLFLELNMKYRDALKNIVNAMPGKNTSPKT